MNLRHVLDAKMLNKSNILKNYLKDIGSKNQLFLLFGNTPSAVSSNTDESVIDVWRNSEITYRVAKKDSIAVVPNITWSSGNIYSKWTSKLENKGQYYAWNKNNGIVYLCLSNNEFNRDDLTKKNASTQTPSHLSGIVKYPDGYTWLALYKITADLLRFVTNSWIPVISFDDFRTNDISKYSQAQKFCSNSQSATVNCGVYFKKPEQIETSPGIFKTYDTGDLYFATKIYCEACYYTFEDSDNFITIAYPSTTTAASKINIVDRYDEIKELVAERKISPSSPYYILYTMSESGLNDGALVSASINLYGFTESQLVTTTPNPEITVSSASGTGARLRFKTYVNIDGENIIEGVELISNGQNYKDIGISIDYSKFLYLTNVEVDQLLASIELNLDTIDGLNFDPVSALGAESIMFDVRLETNVLTQQGQSIPHEVNFYALVENPIELLDGGIEIVAGSQYGKDLAYTDKTTTIVSLSSGTPTIDEGGAITGTTTTGALLSGISITNLGVSGAFTTAELTGLNYSDIEQLDTITQDSIVYSINQIIEKPYFKQYSGKVSQTKILDTSLKLRNASTNSENTKIFRINIVKGF
jgi:hypothetical protein